MNKTVKRIVSCVLVMLMAFSNILTVFAGSTGIPDTYNVKNEYVEFIVNSKNGGFVIKTVEGSMLRKSDENKHILYQGNNYDNSFTTFRIDGKDYIFGNGYGFLNMGGSFISQPQSIGGSINSTTWRIGDVEITQALELVNDKSNPYLGNVKIKYTVFNKGTKNADIGARVLLDTMLDNNDGASFELGDASHTRVVSEKKLSGDEIPQYWKSSDDFASPNIVSYGFTSGWGNSKPDEMIMGHWNNLAAAKWDYTIKPDIDFTKTDSVYGTADSAMALYWKPSAVKAGQSVTYETYYGIMAQNSADRKAGFAVNAVSNKKKLAVDSTGKAYEDDGVFEITADIDNSITGSEDLSDVTATLQLQDGLLVDENKKVQFVQSLAKNNTHTFKWIVKASPQLKYSIKQFKVDVQPKGYTEPVTAGDYMLLPGTVQKEPDILFTGIAPERLYNQGKKYINVKGKGINLYSDKSNWEMYITDVNGSRSQIPDENVTIVDDSQMTIRIDQDFALGEYGVSIEWSGGILGVGTKQVLPVKIAMTDNPKDRNDYYGILCIIKNNLTYDLKTFKDENELASHIATKGKDSILMEFRGYLIKDKDSDTYTADTSLDPVILNNIVVYRGQPMSIKKENGKITVSGDGPIQVIGALTFWKWAFNINVEDGTNYSLEPKPVGKKPLQISLGGLGSMVQTIGGFAISLKYGIFQRELKDGKNYNLISFGGKVSLPVFPGQKDKKPGITEVINENLDDLGKEKDTGSLLVDINNVLFGERKDKAQGFVGIDTKLGIRIPDEAFGGVVKNALSAELTINTIKDIYSVSFGATIMVLECDATLTIRLHEGKYPVPDELRFVGGGDPGIPVVPGVVYVTKLGGGYSKLYETIFGESWLPPLTLHLTGGLSLFGVLDAETAQEISMLRYSIKGSMGIKKIPILKDFHMELSWVDPIFAEAGATLNLFDIVVGTARIYISPDFLEGRASAVVQIPRIIPGLGGTTVAGVATSISTDKVWGQVTFLGIPFGISYYWEDDTVRFASSGDLDLPKDRQYAYARILEGKDNQKYAMLVGTNTHLLASSKKGYNFSSTVLCMASDARLDSMKYFKEGALLTLNSIQNEYSVTVPEKEKAAYLQIEYYDERPSLTVLKPDASEYKLVEHTSEVDGNMRWQELPSGEKYVFVSLVGMDRIDGNWKVKTNTPVDISLIGVDLLPDIKAVQLSDGATAAQKEVSWNIERPAGATANIYLVKSEEDVGVLVAKDIDVAASSKMIIDIPDVLQTGKYFLRINVKKGDCYFDTKLSTTFFNYTNVNQPAKVEGLSVLANGNGYFKINLTDKQSNVDGYIIEAFDSNGKLCESFNSQYFKKGEDIIAGGWRASTEVASYDANGDPVYVDGPYVGLEPGKPYSISVIGIRKIGNKEYFSEALKSSPMLLPVPNPPSIAIAYGESFKTGLDEDGKPIKITNSKEAQFTFSSNQEVGSEIKLDGQTVGAVKLGKTWAAHISAEDGRHILQVISANKNGDVSSEKVFYTVDTVAPQLFIESPKSGTIYTGGKARLNGIFEKGAKYTIKVDGTAIYENNSLNSIINGDGSIDLAIDMSSRVKKLKHEIIISAKDAADNTTLYKAEIIDGSVGVIKNVHIRDKAIATVNLNALEMSAGEKKEIVLIGVDANGREIEFNTGQVIWSTLSGPSMTYVSKSGEISALLPGEAVIIGSYEMGENYSLQDAVVVKVKSTGGGVVPPPDGGKDGSKDDKDDVQYVYPIQQITTVNNIAITELGASILQGLIDKAERQEGRKVIAITIPEVAGAVGYSIGLPVGYISKPTDSIIFKFITAKGTIEVPSNMLYEASQLQTGNVDANKMAYLSIASVDPVALATELQIRIGSHPVIDLSLSVNGKELKWDNPNCHVKISIPYKPTAEEIKDSEYLVALYIDSSGKAVPVPSGRYDSQKGMLSFETTHLSKYAAAYTRKTFKDLAGCGWAKHQIEVLAAKGVINGISQDDFAPATRITRADYLTLLVKTLGLTATVDTNFMDVEPSAYYYDALGIAKKLGITSGTGRNKFNPKTYITREDMIVLTQKALKLAGKSGDSTNLQELEKFKDKGIISSYAAESMAALVKEGLVLGSDDKLNPKGNTTRAEAAVLLYRIYNLKR